MSLEQWYARWSLVKVEPQEVHHFYAYPKYSVYEMKLCEWTSSELAETQVREGAWRKKTAILGFACVRCKARLGMP